MSEYLTVAAIAEELGVCMRTVSRWIAAGELQAIRLPGGQLRIPQTAYTAFKEHHQVVAAAHTLAALDEEAS